MMFVYHYLIIPFHTQYLPRQAPSNIAKWREQRWREPWPKTIIFSLLRRLLFFVQRSSQNGNKFWTQSPRSMEFCKNMQYMYIIKVKTFWVCAYLRLVSVKENIELVIVLSNIDKTTLGALWEGGKRWLKLALRNILTAPNIWLR